MHKWRDHSKSHVLSPNGPPTKIRFVLPLLEILGTSEGDKTYNGADPHRAAELETLLSLHNGPGSISHITESTA